MLRALRFPLLFLAAGCAATAEAPFLAAVPEPPSAPPGEPAARVVALRPGAPGNPVPTLIFEHPRGAEAARAAAGFAQARPLLRECASGGGVIRLTLEGVENRARYAVQSGTGLDPRQRRCVLEALSTVDIDGVLTGSGARPGGFTALIRIDW